MQQYLSSIQDMKACIGMYDASIGNISGEVSGRAILARERQSDIGTYVFSHHRNEAIKRLGRLVLEGMRAIFTDTQTVRVFLPDETEDFVEINKPEIDEESGSAAIMNDITEGEYEVYVDAGPAYNTLRIEAVNSLMEMAQAYPEILTIAGDVLAINMDWPGARALAERLRRFINQRTPGILSPIEIQEIQQQQENIPPPPPDPNLELQAAIQNGKTMQAQFNAQKEEARAMASQAEMQTEIVQAQVAMNEPQVDPMQLREMVAQLIAEYISETKSPIPVDNRVQ